MKIEGIKELLKDLKFSNKGREAPQRVKDLINELEAVLMLCGVSNSLVADIRNKLTPINNLVAMIEDTKVVLMMDKDKAKLINTEIAKVKYTIEYLSKL